MTRMAVEVTSDRSTSEAYCWTDQRFIGGMENVRTLFGEDYATRQGEAGTLGGNRDDICGGRYLDVFECRAGARKILRRRITNEWSISQPSRFIVDQSNVALLNPSDWRVQQDPVYVLGDRGA